jgi:hypothetical protein
VQDELLAELNEMEADMLEADLAGAEPALPMADRKFHESDRLSHALLTPDGEQPWVVECRWQEFRTQHMQMLRQSVIWLH